METAAMLQLIAFGISEGPEVFALIKQIIDGVKKQFATSDERIAALQTILAMLQPLEKEV